MIPHMFTRFFSQYREGGLVTARFQHTASGSVWTRLTTTRQTSHNQLNVVDRGTGLITITFPACRDAVFVGNPFLEPLGDLIANVFTVTPKLLSPSTGTVDLVINNFANPPAVVDPADAAILCFTMYLAR